jgi:hypothetical protein
VANVTAKAKTSGSQSSNMAPKPAHAWPQHPRPNPTFDEFPIAFSSTPEFRSLEAFVRQEASETLHKGGLLGLFEFGSKADIASTKNQLQQGEVS